MTEIALALAFVAVLAFVDRMLSRRVGAERSHTEALRAWLEKNGADVDERLRKLEGLADRVDELENAKPAVPTDVADQVRKAEEKYDAIIRAGINECRQILVSASDPQLRRAMAPALRAVKQKGE